MNSQSSPPDERDRLIAEAIPQIVWVTGPDGKLIYTNERWREYTGLDVSERGEYWGDLIHADDLQKIIDGWQEAVRTKAPYETQVRFKGSDGNYRWFLSRAIPVFDPKGELLEWVGTNTDIEEQKHVEESLQFLASASEILSESLDYEQTLKKVAALAVPQIADWCGVEIVSETGELQQLAIAHIDPSKLELAKVFREKYPTNPDAQTGVPQVIRTGKSEAYFDIPDEMLVAAALSDEHLQMIRDLGIASAITVPLVARKIVFGALSLVSSEARRKFSDTDLRLAEDLGRRAGTAIDNAWLYKKAQEEIKEREETTVALRESEQQYRIVAQTATDAIITIDEKSIIEFVNPAITKIFGYEPSEILGKEVTLLMPEIFREIHKSAVERYALTGQRHFDWEGVELQGLHKDGHQVPLEVSIGEFKHNDRRTFTGIVRDFTERKRVEEELRNSETRFRTMIEQSPLGIQLFDVEGFCIKANRAWEELWSAKRDDLVGYNIRRDPQLEATGMKAFVERAYTGESVTMPPFEYDPTLSGKVGRARWVRIFLYPVKNETNAVSEVAIILEDVTERRKANQELRNAKERAEANEKELEAANQAKDRFLAVLSHELRTPLTPVMATIQTLQSDPAMEQNRKWLDLIERNIELEARLIDDLLDLTRITRGKLELDRNQVDIHALIENVVEIYQSEINGKRLTLTLNLEAEHHLANVDPARMQQVFWNLSKNAVKFTPAGGNIAIHTFNQVIPNNTPSIVIEFTDTGIGIEQDVLPRIFEAFEQGETTITRTFGGLGLGLSISKHLIDLHGGTLTASSSGKDKGSIFRVELQTALNGYNQMNNLQTSNHPSESNSHSNSSLMTKPIDSNTPANKSRQPSPLDEGKSQGKAAAGAMQSTILLIDDHIDTGTAVKMLLERHGFKVLIANSAAQALTVANNNKLDLVISDIGLPDESGLTLIAKLKAAQNQFGEQDDRSPGARMSDHPIPAIALSGFGTEDDIERSREAGFQEHLTKPFNLNKLRETIARLLGK